jgi:hypothetical protein
VREFLQQASHVEVAPPPSVLDSPLKSLQQSLDALEQRRSVISQKVQEVSETLTRVKKIHAEVKAEYNSAMAHTSSVYPEVRPNKGRPVDEVLNKLFSFPKLLPWRRDTRTGTSSCGRSAWMRLLFSWIRLHRSGGTTGSSSVLMRRTFSSSLGTETNSLESQRDTQSRRFLGDPSNIGLGLSSVSSSHWPCSYCRHGQHTPFRPCTAYHSTRRLACGGLVCHPS